MIKLITWFKKHVRPISSLPNTSGNPVSNNDNPSNSIGLNPSPLVSPAVPPRRRRRRRRTTSIVGLPLYSEEPHDAEMTLWKHADSRVDYNDSDDEEEEEEEEEGNYGLSDSINSLQRPSIDSRPPLTTSISTPLPITIVPSSSTPILAVEETESIHTPTGSISILRHHASYSISSQNSIPSSPIQETGIVGVGRTRASTLRSIFNRNNSSSGSLPLSITRSPYGQGGGSLPRNASSTSISSLNISSPLPHSLVSTAFVFPINGLTPEQLTFLSSTESLGKYGYGVGEGATLPPSFAPEPAVFVDPIRRNRGGSVSSNSPLRASTSSTNSPELYMNSPLSPAGSQFPSNAVQRNSIAGSPIITEQFLTVPTSEGGVVASSITAATRVDSDDSYFPKITDTSISLGVASAT